MSDGERKILIEFYHSTNGPKWKNNKTWCSEEPLSTWYGVEVQDGHVVSLYLSGNGLKGIHCYILLLYTGVHETLPGKLLTATCPVTFFYRAYTSEHM